MGRLRQAARRLFLGNRPRCLCLDMRARRRARRETRSRDLTMATPSCPKMVRSFFSPRESGVAIWRFSGSEAIGLATGRLSRAVVPSAAGAGNACCAKPPIYHDSPALGMSGLSISFASARHFLFGRPLANSTLNPDRKQCWQVAVSLSLTRM